uniref:Uncharacterized protein n=1 Tax=Fagus sylvatica TaxID=28930 RepID=A0A2N9G6K2_FAGSY
MKLSNPVHFNSKDRFPASAKGGKGSSALFAVASGISNLALSWSGPTPLLSDDNREYLASELGFLLNGMRRPLFLLSQYFVSPMPRFNLLLALVPGPRKGVQVCLRISNHKGWSVIGSALVLDLPSLALASEAVVAEVELIIAYAPLEDPAAGLSETSSIAELYSNGKVALSLLSFRICSMFEIYEVPCEATSHLMVGEEIRFLNFILAVHLVYDEFLVTANLKMIDSDFHDSVNDKECGIMCPSGVMNLIPTPEVNSSLELVRVAPSKSISHLSRGCPGKVSMWKTGSSGRSSFRLESGGNGCAARKSAIACPFTAFCGTYTMSNWDNRMDHLASLALSDPALATKIFSGFTRDIRLVLAEDDAVRPSRVKQASHGSKNITELAIANRGTSKLRSQRSCHFLPYWCFLQDLFRTIWAGRAPGQFHRQAGEITPVGEGGTSLLEGEYAVHEQVHYAFHLQVMKSHALSFTYLALPERIKEAAAQTEAAGMGASAGPFSNEAAPTVASSTGSLVPVSH